MQQQVDFYLISNLIGDGQLKLASRLSNKIQRLKQRALLVADNENQLARLDEVLWTFNDTSFVPHEIITETSVDIAREQGDGSARIFLSKASNPQLAKLSNLFDVVVNLAESVPEGLAHYKRIAEIVDADENSKSISRNKYKDYRARGAQPNTHNIQL